MHGIVTTVVCISLGAAATAAHGAWERVLDISTATTCRDAEGIAYRQSSGTLLAVKGNTLFEVGAAARPMSVVQVDQEVVPDFNGLESLSTGNLLLASAEPRRLYEITPDGQTIATKTLGDRVAPRGVAYCPQRKRVYVLDGADRTVKEYSTAEKPEAVYKIRLADARALEVPQPGVLWVLDGRQRKIFSHRPGEALTELLDLAQFCDYEGPSGMAWDRSRGVLYICFAKSQRIVGMIQLPQPPSSPPAGSSNSQAASAAEFRPATAGDQHAADDQAPPGGVEVPSPYPESTIVVKPPHPPTIYVLPLIVRGNAVNVVSPVNAVPPSGPAPLGRHRAASPVCPPDLTVSALEVLSLTGGRVTFRYLVTNASPVPANLDGVIVHALVSADHLRNPGDKLVADHAFYGEVLGPRQSRCVTDTGVLRQGFRGRPFLIVRVDTADRLAESNEENNTTVTLTTFAR